MTKKTLLTLSILVITFFTGIYIGENKEVYLHSEKYSDHIGRISIEGAVQLDSIVNYFGRNINGFYHSSAPEIYRGSKYKFKKYILAEYDSSKYSDSGYLTYRFYINDEAEVIMYKIHELNLELAPSKLDNALVNEITELIIQKKHWYPFEEKNTIYYMHLTFRIENGKITEIIP